MKSQIGGPLAIIIAGVAGSGKTTLGRQVASQLGAPLLDLDSVTNPLLDELVGSADSESSHWLSADNAAAVRRGRYAALLRTAADVLETLGVAVIVAPFTAERRGGPEWSTLLDTLSPARVEVFVVHGDPELFAQRRAARGMDRDEHRDASDDGVTTVIDHHLIDADLNTLQQTHRVLMQVTGARPPHNHPLLPDNSFDAVLFDLDGTLVDSTASVNRCWRKFAEHYGVSAQALEENHGKTAKNLVQILLPDSLQDEGLARITELEVADAAGVRATAGAQQFFHSVAGHQRAVVTSGSIPIATARLTGAHLTIPAVMVTADRVTHGKPHPEPFLTAAHDLGVSPERCLVFEDAPAGITSAKEAGCTVVAIRGTVADRDLAHADLIIDSFDQVMLDTTPDGDYQLVVRQGE